MDLEAFAARAQQIVAVEAEGVPGFGALEVRADRQPHPFLEGQDAFVDVVPDVPDEDAEEAHDPWRLVLHHGSFLSAAQDPALELEALLDRAVVFGLGQVAERALLPAEIADEEALLRAHARFLRGLDVQAGWHRAGEVAGARLWGVDLDLFVDLVLPRERWAALAGTSIVLRLLGETIPFELPADADLGEAWTLPEGGLFEPAPGVEEEDVEAGEEVPGSFGDLHLVPLAF
jgi:hypothetical protein